MSSAKRGKRSDLKGLGLRAMMSMPRFVWAPMIAGAARWYSRFPNRAIRRWQYNAEVVLGRRPTRAETAQAFRSWGRNLFDSLTMSRVRLDGLDHRIEISDDQRERLMTAARQGAVAALPHMGSWDLAGAWAGRVGLPVSAVAEQLPPREFTLFSGVRERLGMRVYGHRDRRAIVKLIQDVREGRLACLVSDRDMSRNGIAVQWPTPGGIRPITLPPGPALIAQRTQRPLIPVACHYLPGNRMRLEIGPLIDAPASPDAIASIMQQLCDFFAAQVAADVTDWHMLQRFFPDTPEEPRP